MELNPEKQELNIDNSERVKEPKKERKQALTCPNKVSSFFITINTNYFVGDKSEKDLTVYKSKFENVLAEMLPNFHEFVEFKTSKLGAKYGYGENDTRDILMKPNRILENSLKYVLEVSPSHRLHAHILFYMKKKGVDTKVIIPKIKEVLEAKMGHSCYVNYKLVSTVMSIENYLKKNPLD